VMAKALIAGRIDCKTAGRLLVHLQTMSKLLRIVHWKRTSTTEARRHGEQQKMREEAESPQICVEERILNRGQELPRLPTPQAAMPSMIEGANHVETPRAAFQEVPTIPEKPRSLQHGKWEQPRAA
jgi:hypothetical protein